jgi:hypothetical protein
MSTLYWCRGFCYAQGSTYRDVNCAAFAWHRETDPLGEYLRSLPDIAKAIVSLGRGKDKTMSWVYRRINIDI